MGRKKDPESFHSLKVCKYINYAIFFTSAQTSAPIGVSVV